LGNLATGNRRERDGMEDPAFNKAGEPVDIEGNAILVEDDGNERGVAGENEESAVGGGKRRG